MILLILGGLASGFLSALDKRDETSRRARAGALRQQSHEHEPLQRQWERLRQLQLGAEERASLQRAAAEHARIRRELAARESASDRSPPSQLAVGRWLSPAAWKNRG